MAQLDGPCSVAQMPAEAATRRTKLKVLLAAPRGFCAGVRRAIEAVEDALTLHGAPVYVRRAIVHNLAVVRALEAKGAVFVEEVAEVPPGAVLVLSAHGVAQKVVEEGAARALRMIDAMCPLVGKVHREVARHHREGRHVVLIGHQGHPEIEGTLGQVPAGAATVVADLADVNALQARGSLAYAVQTTFSVEEADVLVARLEQRFPGLSGPSGSDICYATTNRQAAVREIAPKVDAMIVVGESFSSNARRLCEVAAAQGCASVQLAADRDGLDWAALAGGTVVGVTAAASTPESSVASVLDALKERFDVAVEEVGDGIESTSFRRVRIAS
jgi:4-hydroxy-3-methylbut-2-enyl diphosphate reductase